MKEVLNKFKSRKFLLALLNVILGVLGILGYADNDIELVSSIVMILIPTIVYIVTEGKIDAAAVGKVLDNVEDIIDIVDDTYVIGFQVPVIEEEDEYEEEEEEELESIEDSFKQIKDVESGKKKFKSLNESRALWKQWVKESEDEEKQ